jgi:lysozyme family protein
MPDDDFLPDALRSDAPDPYDLATATVAIREVLKHEGSAFVENSEIGEVSKYGVSLSTYREKKPNATIDDIKKLTEEQATAFYLTEFWLKHKVYLLRSKAVKIKLLDGMVNVGPKTAIALLQRAINRLVKKNAQMVLIEALKEDGLIGPKTVQACAAFWYFEVVNEFCALLEDHYRGIARAGKQHAKFLDGWIARARWKPSLL